MPSGGGRRHLYQFIRFFQGASVYQTHTETTLHATSVAKGRIHAVRNAA